MSVTGYSRMQIRLHWAVFALVALQFLLAGGMSSAFDKFMETGEKSFSILVALHILPGVLVLILAVWRIVLRMLRGVPAPDPSHSPAQVMVARVMYGLFYVLLVLLPVSGMVAWSQGSGMAGNVHSALRVVLMILIVLHVAAALAGQYIKKDGTLARMMKSAD
ncbi:cytochrome b561 [Rhodovulum bhavnagarense]|uniref:Cytochrome b561 n=1 Tax=Rhodovulum bhavnagarense TaxID=992286 RepID=A0A4V6NRJ7_9RHOB|nr:cytochrome b/b6 domain-containing protein [Rhodovulum bhavnagarense]TCP60266.1 cytochrome b561 [Rhodovulum bhavnagarense]